MTRSKRAGDPTVRWLARNAMEGSEIRVADASAAAAPELGSLGFAKSLFQGSTIKFGAGAIGLRAGTHVTSPWT